MIRAVAGRQNWKLFLSLQVAQLLIFRHRQPASVPLWQTSAMVLSRIGCGFRLAHQDMRLRYRGSMLGPFWQTITTVVLIGSMGFIYAKLFHVELKDYMPLLTSG